MTRKGCLSDLHAAYLFQPIASLSLVQVRGHNCSAVATSSVEKQLQCYCSYSRDRKTVHSFFTMRNIKDTDSSASTFPERHQIRPVDNATTPYWRSEPHAIDEHRSTERLPQSCDIAIIGAGFAGVATAYHLDKLHEGKDKPSVVMLEARQVCSGATGRNGVSILSLDSNLCCLQRANVAKGHVKMKASSVQGLIAQHGPELAMEVRDLVIAQIYALKDVVETEDLDCEFELRRSYDVFIDSDEAENACKNFKASVKAGERWTRDVDLVESKNVEQVGIHSIVTTVITAPLTSLSTRSHRSKEPKLR